MSEIIEEMKELLKEERRFREAGIKLLSSNEVADKLSISRAYLEKQVMHRRGFPKPIQLVDNGHKRWYAHEVDEFILKIGGRA